MKTLLSIYFLFSLFALKSQTDIDFYLNKAQKEIDEENYPSAIKSLSKALDFKETLNSSYKIANLYVTRGVCKYKLKKYKDANKDMDIALTYSPEYIKAFENKNKIYFDSRQFDKVITNSKIALQLNPKDGKFLMWVSQSYIQKHNYDDAMIYADSILHNSPDDISALSIKSQILHKQKKYIEAIEIDNSILNQKPNDPIILLNRGLNYASLKEYDKAEKDIYFASTIDTSLLYVAHNNIAYFIKIDSKDFKSAIELFDKCLLLKPDFAFGYSNRGFCKLQLGDVSGALKDLNKSLELDPNNSYALKNYALIKIKEKKTKEACAYLKEANEKGYSIEYDEDVNELIKTNCK